MGVEVCPVHKAEFKKSAYIPYIHVGAMSQNPQPGGLKRKRPDDEDEDEDPPSAPDPIRRQPYVEDKQQMLDLTYSKLERLRYTNTSLSKYVLIINTIRNFEQEMIRDGLRVLPILSTIVPATNHQVPFDPTRPPPPDDTRTNLNGLEDVVTSVNYTSTSYSTDTNTRTGTTTSVINSSETPSDIFGGISNGTPYSTEYDRYLMDLDSPSSGRATPFVRNEVESCALWNEDSDRLTSLNWSSVLNLSSVDGGSPIAASSFYSETSTPESPTSSCNFDTSSNSSSGCSDCSILDETMSNPETSLHTLMPVTTGIPTGLNSAGVSSTSSSSSPRATSTLGSSSSYSGSSPPNSEDEIFGDIDLTLYDYDFTPLSPPNVRMAPVSAEELMQSLDSDHRVDSSIGEHLTPVRT